MGSYSVDSWTRSCIDSWPGGRPEGIGGESVLRGLLKREDGEGGGSGDRVEARSLVFRLFESW